MYKVGDSVYIVEPCHKETIRYHSKITKVGRKYIYASGRYIYDLRFSLTPTPEGYLRGTEGYQPPRLYGSEESFEAHNTLKKLRRAINAYFSDYSANRMLTLEQCQAIAQILGLELP
jgi:hypothetical protein